MIEAPEQLLHVNEQEFHGIAEAIVRAVLLQGYHDVRLGEVAVVMDNSADPGYQVEVLKVTHTTFDRLTAYDADLLNEQSIMSAYLAYWRLWACSPLTEITLVWVRYESPA